jgi:hypothetical protein
MKILKEKKALKILFIVFTLLILFNAKDILAQPAGLEITGNVTDSAGSAIAGNRTDSGGTITTILVDVLQQNPRWKAYIGNISGTLTLDDSSGQSIFRWELEATDVTGNIFISRSNSISWGDVDCSTPQQIADEDTALGFSSTAADSINRTFNETHPSITLGVTPLNNCPATSTYVNNAPQATPDYPLVLLSENANMIFATPINKIALNSYNPSQIVDFQAIVPDQTVGTSTYYFYAEIGA